jgi:hypothetical protein
MRHGPFFVAKCAEEDITVEFFQMIGCCAYSNRHFDAFNQLVSIAIAS